MPLTAGNVLLRRGCLWAKRTWRPSGQHSFFVIRRFRNRFLAHFFVLFLFTTRHIQEDLKIRHDRFLARLFQFITHNLPKIQRHITFFNESNNKYLRSSSDIVIHSSIWKVRLKISSALPAVLNNVCDFSHSFNTNTGKILYKGPRSHPSKSFPTQHW